MYAIEYQLLKETDDAIGAIFLEEPKPDHIRTLASIELKRPVNKPDTDATNAGVSAAFERRLGPMTASIPLTLGATIQKFFWTQFAFSFLPVAVGMCFLITYLWLSQVFKGEDERKALDYITNKTRR